MSTIELPPIITEYIADSNKKGAADAALYFTEDGTAKDEGKIYHGLDEIRKWRSKVGSAYDFNVEVLDTDKKGDTYLVLAKLTGTFPPPNPVTITYHFKLKDGKIADLFIG